MMDITAKISYEIYALVNCNVMRIREAYLEVHASTTDGINFTKHTRAKLSFLYNCVMNAERAEESCKCARTG